MPVRVNGEWAATGDLFELPLNKHGEPISSVLQKEKGQKCIYVELLNVGKDWMKGLVSVAVSNTFKGGMAKASSTDDPCGLLRPDQHVWWVQEGCLTYVPLGKTFEVTLPELKPTACLRCTSIPPYYVKNHKDGFVCFSCRASCAGLPLMEGLL